MHKRGPQTQSHKHVGPPQAQPLRVAHLQARGEQQGVEGGQVLQGVLMGALHACRRTHVRAACHMVSTRQPGLSRIIHLLMVPVAKTPTSQQLARKRW